MEDILKIVEKHRELMFFAERKIWNNPETGYKEWETSRFLAENFERLGYNLIFANNIPGFYTDIDTGKKGPTVLVLAELDALICPSHPERNQTTNAVHACGHNAQCAAILGVAAALKEPEVLKGLCGKIRLCLIPAEEGIEMDFRINLVKEGVINFTSGKAEFISRGYFDDVDLALMVHIMTKKESPKMFGITKGANGVIKKQIVFNGIASHAGEEPESGVNALYAANLLLNAINALRETFKEEDHIRVHPIITKGGNTVNTIPDEVILE